MTTILGFDTYDVRFPTSRHLDGSDAMNTNPDYSAAYLVLRTDAADGTEALAGHAHVFTIGRGNTTFPLDLLIFVASIRNQPCAHTCFGNGSIAAIRKAGQYTVWNRMMSFPTRCTSAGHIPRRSYSGPPTALMYALNASNQT